MSTTLTEVDIRVDLQNEDESGYVWAFLDRAVHANRIQRGATVVAGNSGGRCLARVVDILGEGSEAIVHLDLLPGSVSAFLAQRSVA